MPSILFVMLGMLLCVPQALADLHAGDTGVSEQCFVLQWQESEAIAALFDKAGVTGTFAMLDPQEKRLVGFDHRRVKQRFVPASSFKVAHTLIGLHAEAVTSVDEVLPWDGTPQPFPGWEQEMSLRQAIAVSNAAIYQQLARRIGPEVMQRELNRLGYGNAELGREVDRFWLDGPLQISLLEQLRFLTALAQRQLPYRPSSQAAVREIIAQPAPSGVSLFAKSGWENAPGPGVGWWVGWVEKDGKVYAFGMNMDIQSPDQAAQRESLARASLSLLGLL